MKTSIMKIGMALLCIAAVLTAPVCAASTSDQATTGPYRIAYPCQVQEQTAPGELAYSFPVEEQKQPGELAYPYSVEEKKECGNLAYPFEVQEQTKNGTLVYPHRVQEQTRTGELAYSNEVKAQEASSAASTGTAGQGDEEFKYEIIMIRAHIAAFDHILEFFENAGYDTSHAQTILKEIGKLAEALEEAFATGDMDAVKSIHEMIKRQAQNFDRALMELIPPVLGETA
jgi:hypothetical protein